MKTEIQKSLAFSHDWQDFAVVWIAYAGIQGAVDAAQVFPTRPKGSED
jgi:hypothetical protein